MPVNITALKAANLHRWQSMHIRHERLTELVARAHVLVAADNKARYEKISAGVASVTNIVIPWWCIAVIHEREGGGPPHFDVSIAQGDKLGRPSTHEPAGRGPFLNHKGDPEGEDAFFRGALDALIDCAPHAGRWTDWSIGGALTLLEEYNGLGYAAMHIPSAYVWSGTDQYTAGKFVADHVFRANAVDVQEGCAPLIALMAAFDETIKPDIYFEAQESTAPPHPMEGGPTDVAMLTSEHDFA